MPDSRHLVFGLLLLVLLSGALGLSRSGGTIARISSVDGVVHDGGFPPVDGRDDSTFARSSHLHLCLIGGVSGGRQYETSIFGFAQLLRFCSTGTILRAGFLPERETPSLYGVVRPHLFLCRLRN